MSVLEHLIDFTRGPRSSVDLATDYGLDAQGSGTKFSASPDGPWGQSSLV